MDSTLARHQLTFYRRPLTETNSVAWLLKAAYLGYLKGT